MMKKSMNQSEWIDWYVKHGGQEDLHLRDDELVLFHPQHGFLAFYVLNDALVIHHMAGDGKFWQSVIINILKLLHLNKAQWYTERNPNAWIRKFGGKIKGYYMECDLIDTKF